MVWRQMLGLAYVVLHILLSVAAVAVDTPNGSKGRLLFDLDHKCALILPVLPNIFSLACQPCTTSRDPGSHNSSILPTSTATAVPVDPIVKEVEQKQDYNPVLGGLRRPLVRVKPIESHHTQIIAASDESSPAIGLLALLISQSAVATTPLPSTTYSGSVSVAASGSPMFAHAKLPSNGIGTLTSSQWSDVRGGSRPATSSNKDLLDFPLATPTVLAKGIPAPYPTGHRSSPNTTASNGGQPLASVLLCSKTWNSNSTIWDSSDSSIMQTTSDFTSGAGIRYLAQSGFPMARPYNVSNGYHKHAGSAGAISALAIATVTTVDNVVVKFLSRPTNLRKPSTHSFIPSSRLKAHPLGIAFSNCSGVVTIYPATLTKVITFTILVNETITLTPNATTPAPVFITPLPACQTITSSCAVKYDGICPGNYFQIIPGKPAPKAPGHLAPMTTSTLLVTKKSPAIIHQGQAVGNIFGPTSTAQPVAGPVALQTPADGNDADAPPAQQTGNAGSAGAEMQTQSDGMSTSQSDDDGQTPGSTTPQQEPQAENAPPAAPKANDVNSQQTGIDSNGGQVSSGQSSGAQASGGQYPGGQYPGGQSPGGQSPGGQSPGGQPSDGQNSEGQSSGGQRPSSAGQDSGSQTSDESSGGDQTTSNGDTPASGSNAGSNVLPQSHNSSPDLPGSGQTVSEQPSSGGPSKSSQNEYPGMIGSTPSGDQSTSNDTFGNDGNSADEKGSSQGSTDSVTNQYVSKTLAANGVPISIGPSAVMVGSLTISAGSPPTTFVVQGKIIAVQPSQILAAGTTIPIEAAATPPPATSIKIGIVPVVMQPDNLMIGSQSFSHGSSAGTAVYNGQTYSWDAGQLVGPGTTAAFPSAGSVPAPRVTAAGQVFSVFPSSLKAAGLTLALPNTPKASPFVYKGQTFSINLSQLIAPARSVTIPSPGNPTPFVYGGNTLSVDASQFIAVSTTMPLSAGSGVVTYKDQKLTIRPSQVAGPSTTIALSAKPQAGVAETPSAITTRGLTFSLGPSAAVIDSSTYSFLPGKAPVTITSHGQAIIAGSKGIHIGNLNIPIPTTSHYYSVVTEGDLTLSLAPSKVVLGGHTHDIQSPTSTVINGQTISIGPYGVGLGRTTIPLPTPKQGYQVVTEGDLTFSVAPSEAVIKGSTFAIGPNVPATMVVGGQILSIGPHGIEFPGTTVDLPTVTSEHNPAAMTADGLTFSVGPTDAIIDGSIYPISNKAPAETIVVGSETMKLGPGGVILLSTTIPPEQTPSAITANNLTFSADASEAIINGTTYQIGSGAMAMTIVAGSQTIKLGTNRIVLPWTTIAPWKHATGPGIPSPAGTGGAAGATPPTGLPRSGSTNKTGRPHSGAATSLKPPYSVRSGIIIGALILGLLLL